MYKASVIKSYCFIGFLLYLAVIIVGKQCEIFKFIGESGYYSDSNIVFVRIANATQSSFPRICSAPVL